MPDSQMTSTIFFWALIIQSFVNTFYWNSLKYCICCHRQGQLGELGTNSHQILFNCMNSNIKHSWRKDAKMKIMMKNATYRFRCQFGDFKGPKTQALGDIFVPKINLLECLEFLFFRWFPSYLNIFVLQQPLPGVPCCLYCVVCIWWLTGGHKVSYCCVHL